MPKELRAELHEGFAEWLEREARVRRGAGRVRGISPRAVVPVPGGARSRSTTRGARSRPGRARTCSRPESGRWDVATSRPPSDSWGERWRCCPPTTLVRCRRCRPSGRRCTTGVSSSEHSSTSRRRPSERPTRARTRSAHGSPSFARWSGTHLDPEFAMRPALGGGREAHGVAGGRGRRPRPGRGVVDHRGVPILARATARGGWRRSNGPARHAERAGSAAAHPTHLQRVARPLRVGTGSS